MQILPEVLETAAHYQKEKKSNQSSFFDLLGENQGPEQSYQIIALPSIPPWTEKEKLQYEKQFIGFYVTGHPLNGHLVDLRSLSDADTRELKQKKDRDQVSLVGLITQVTPRLDRNGNTYAHVTLDDFQGSIRLILFSRTYEKYKDLLVAEQAVYVKGNVSTGRNEPEIIVREMSRPEAARKKIARVVEFELSPVDITDQNLEQIRAICRKNRGRLKLRISVNKPGLGKITLEAGKKINAAPTDELVSGAATLAFPHTLRFIATENRT